MGVESWTDYSASTTEAWRGMISNGLYFLCQEDYHHLLDEEQASMSLYLICEEDNREVLSTWSDLLGGTTETWANFSS